MRLNPRVVAEIDSPITAAHALLAERAGKRELLDLSQAAPPYPPAPEVVAHVAAVAGTPDGARYLPNAGLPKLREAFAAELSTDYKGQVSADHVLVTAGCNQAFCVVVQALAGPGDEVILTLPYYFNHDMWLRMTGIVPVYLEPGEDLVPSVEAARSLITPRTRAIVLVTPGNPSGATVPPARIEEFAALAAETGIALILDETYRSFRDDPGPPHRLFDDPGWGRTVVSLHSFSKDLALPGYRVGAVVAAPELNRELAKVLDCVAICAPRVGQEAAWAGLTRAYAWREERRREVAECRRRFVAAMAARPGGFELVCAGGFFGWVRHPFPDRGTDEVVRLLAHRFDTLVIPGTAFLPEDRGVFRVSVSNLGAEAVADFTDRLAAAAAS